MKLTLKRRCKFEQAELFFRYIKITGGLVRRDGASFRADAIYGHAANDRNGLYLNDFSKFVENVCAFVFYHKRLSLSKP